MRREDLADLTMFLAVVEEGSFTGAAKKLGLSQSALSHTIRRLEVRLGLRLLTRTTRSLAPTEAGERLLETLRPAIDRIDERLSALTALRPRPAGTIRVTTSEHAAETILWPAVDRITAAHPDVTIELDVASGLTDIVAERFDAGVRLGEQIAKDMVAVRIGPQLRMAAVGSPAYFAQHGKPASPRDLADHRCINLRLATAGGLYAWEFEKDGREIKTKVDGQLVFNRMPLILKAVIAGHGVGFVIEDQVGPLLANGSLVRVLEDWCPPFDGYHLYYPTHRQASPAFRILVDALRYRT
jgi:DNA-binding transcriptional LysR family regulator